MSYDEQYPADACANRHEYEQERIRLTERLSAAEAARGELEQMYSTLESERNEINRQRINAEAAARWLLYDAPGLEYSVVDAYIKRFPWLAAKGGVA